MSGERDARPLIAHVMLRFDVGGLENGIVNLINRMPAELYRHAVVALTEVTEFSRRITRPGVSFVGLHKPPGHVLRIYPQLYRLFRSIRPAIVHTRNLAALEAAVPAWLAGIPVRIHGEHGRDVGDFDGSSRKHQLIRRLYRPFVNQYVAVSRDLEHYLTSRVGVAADRVIQIYNGVDTQRFQPNGRAGGGEGYPFDAPGLWVVGSVGRMEVVKDQLTLARAFIRALEIDPAQRSRLRLVLVGDGVLRRDVQALLATSGLPDLAWVPGERSDISAIMPRLDCFVLPSRGEGISNTILEAMACGLPVIATEVGGNAELVEGGRTGELVPAGDVEAMAQKVLAYAREPERARAAGRAGRLRVERSFSLESMVERYILLYDLELRRAMPRMHRISAT
jgi:sugar transferase (PEP-CTERM/EpsH1 system associated)